MESPQTKLLQDKVKLYCHRKKEIFLFCLTCLFLLKIFTLVSLMNSTMVPFIYRTENTETPYFMSHPVFFAAREELQDPKIN